MAITIIITIISASLLGISKAAADIVQHIDLWNTSIFSKALETSFWGPKDKTWIRKDHDNKILNWLLHYSLVWITDIWHFANMCNSMCIILLFVCFHSTCISLLYMLLLYYSTYTIMFNLFYHFIFKKHD